MAEIRVLSEADAGEFWALRLRALREEPESFGSSFEESAQIPPAEILKRLHCSDDAFVLGAVTPKLVGMVGFRRREGLKLRHKGIIWGVYVAPENRGQGVARSLLSAAIARASTLPGLERLTLAVMTANQAAHRFYRSLGFISYGIEPSALKVAGKYLDEDFMELTLAAATDQHR